MLSTYRRAFELPGAWRFSGAGLVARLPIAMIGLGIVLLVSTTTGSYALAGALSAAFQVTAAFGAIATSRWVDRVGQGRLLPGLALVHGLALTGFALAVDGGAPLPLQFALAALAGAAQPAIGSMVRARWAHAAQDPVQIGSAFAVESIVDELLFSVGPMLTAFLAIQIALPLPLLVAAVLAVVGSLALAAQRSTQPPPHGRPEPQQAGPRGGALGHAGMPFLFVVALGIGGVFGTYEVAVVAFTALADSPGASGWVLGLYALGSMVAGLVFGARHLRIPLPRQALVATAALIAVLVPAPLVGTIPGLALVTFVAGAGAAPALIVAFSLTERLVPARLLTEGLTWTNSGLALGYSAGAWSGGFAVDASGTTAAFALSVVSAGIAAVACLVGQRTLMRSVHPHEEAPPAAALNADPVPGPTPGAVLDDPD